MEDIKYFSTVVEYLTHPLVVVGFVLLLFFSIHRQLISSGIIQPLHKKDGSEVVNSILRYGFYISLTVIVLGFVLKWSDSFFEFNSKSRESDSLTEELVASTTQEVSGNFTNSLDIQAIELIWNEDTWDRNVDIVFKGDIVNSIEGGKVKYRSLCVDKKNKLQNLIFTSYYESAGHPGDVVFVYYDRDSRAFKSAKFDYYGEEMMHPDRGLTKELNGQTICTWREKYNKSMQISDFYHMIKPSVERTYFGEMIKEGYFKHQFPLKTRIIDDNLVDSLKSYEDIDVSTLLNNEKWQVKSISYNKILRGKDGCWFSWGH